MKHTAWLLALVALVLAACGAPPPLPVATSSAGTVAELKVIPSPPVPLEETILELTLRDGAGRPIVGASVAMDLTMPAMAMPPNHPEVAEVGDGVYRARAVFTMAGDWEIDVDVAYAAQAERFAFAASTR
jgi:hypothetical protein